MMQDMEKLIVRVTHDEKERVEHYAASRGMSLTAVTREWAASLPESYPSMTEIVRLVRKNCGDLAVKSLWLSAPPAETEKRDARFIAVKGDADTVTAALKSALGYPFVTVDVLSRDDVPKRCGSVKILPVE